MRMLSHGALLFRRNVTISLLILRFILQRMKGLIHWDVILIDVIDGKSKQLNPVIQAIATAAQMWTDSGPNPPTSLFIHDANNAVVKQ